MACFGTGWRAGSFVLRAHHARQRARPDRNPRVPGEPGRSMALGNGAELGGYPAYRDDRTYVSDWRADFRGTRLLHQLPAGEGHRNVAACARPLGHRESAALGPRRFLGRRCAPDARQSVRPKPRERAQDHVEPGTYGATATTEKSQPEEHS